MTITNVLGFLEALFVCKSKLKFNMGENEPPCVLKPLYMTGKLVLNRLIPLGNKLPYLPAYMPPVDKPTLLLT